MCANKFSNAPILLRTLLISQYVLDLFGYNDLMIILMWWTVMGVKGETLISQSFYILNFMLPFLNIFNASRLYSVPL